MSGRTLLVIAVTTLVVAALLAIVWSTMDLAQYTAEVCITYKGRTECRVASGTTREEAIETGRTTACALLASGVGETIACGNTEPDSVRWISE